MRIPQSLPSRPKRGDGARRPLVSPATANRSSAAEIDSGDRGLSPAACCAEACIKTPLGKICHCVLDLPICP